MMLMPTRRPRQDTRGGQARACAGPSSAHRLSPQEPGARGGKEINASCLRVGELLTAPSCPLIPSRSGYRNRKSAAWKLVLKIRDLVTVICIAPDGSLYTYHRHDHRFYIRLCIATFLFLLSLRLLTYTVVCTMYSCIYTLTDTAESCSRAPKSKAVHSCIIRIATVCSHGTQLLGIPRLYVGALERKR